MTSVTVREATPDELATVLGILDGAALETDAERVRAAIERGDVLVAVPGGPAGDRDGTDDSTVSDSTDDTAGSDSTDDSTVSDSTDDSTVSDSTERTPVGALVLDGDEIATIAVRRRRRGQGIGTALVEAAADRRETLVAEFDAGVRPFYESLGFAVESVGDGRCRGRLGP